MNKKRMEIVSSLMEQAITRMELFVKSCEGNTNPQVVEMRLRSEGELATMKDVYYAIHGDMMNLRIAAWGTIEASHE